MNMGWPQYPAASTNACDLTGEWVPLEMVAANVVAGFGPPEIRREGSGVVRIRGSIKAKVELPYEAEILEIPEHIYASVKPSTHAYPTVCALLGSGEENYPAALSISNTGFRTIYLVIPALKVKINSTITLECTYAI